ncbi:hypothetical protein D9M70_588100 [compost metagenome]
MPVDRAGVRRADPLTQSEESRRGAFFSDHHGGAEEVRRFHEPLLPERWALGNA